MSCIFPIFAKKNTLRYFIHLAYNGSSYHGWQSQQNAHSVQGEVEKCLSLKIGESVKISGCGRTDTGVHARNYYAHFDLVNPVQSDHLEVLTTQIDRFLPKDITLFKIWPVPDDANARFDALTRTYHYHITRSKNPFLTDFSWHIFGHLSIDDMQQAANLLIGKLDFTSFAKLHAQTKTNICNVQKAHWHINGDELLFEISADRFLRNMVRAIVGTLVEVGQGKLSVAKFAAIMQKKNRSSAGLSAPAHALFLQDVVYPETIMKGQLYNKL